MLLPTLRKRRIQETPQTLSNVDFLIKEPLEAYRANEHVYLSAEHLNAFREDAFVYFKRRRGLLPKESPNDRIVDRAALLRILQGQKAYESQYVSGGPVDPKTGERFSNYSREYTDWAAAQDRTVLTDEQAQHVDQIVFGIRGNREVCHLLAEGAAHGVIRCEYLGLPCQSRIDWTNPECGLVAFAFLSDFWSLESRLRNGGSVHRLAFEQSLVAEITAIDLPTHIVAIEKQSPHRCGIWRVSPELLRKAKVENDDAVERFKRCCDEDHWPSNFEDVRILAAN